MKGKTNTAADFWGRVQRGAAVECWPWLGAVTSRGYGTVGIEGRDVATHRLAYELTHGPILDGLFACHRCDNPRCCNPAHIFAGTPKDNQVDCARKGRKNFPLGERHGSAKLDADKVRAIRARRAAGEHLKSIAQSFGVGIMTIHQVVTGRTWSHV